MRLAFACLTLLPAAAFADTFAVNSAPNAVTVYAGAGKVTREISVQVPEGRHEIILPGLPRTIDPQFLRIGVDGAQLGSTQFRASAVMPQPAADSEAVETAKDVIKTAERALRDLDDSINEARLAAVAANTKAGFLGALGSNEGLPTDVSSLRDIANMIGTETLRAVQDAFAADQAATALNEARPDLERDLKNARAALTALTPPPEETAQLTITLLAPASGEVDITLSYLVQASWQPVYDVYLSEGKLTLHRDAMVSQWSGESWQDVSLRLSTFALDQQTEPSDVVPIPRRIADKPAPLPKTLMRSTSSDLSGAAMMESPVMVDEAAIASFDGPGVLYSAPNPVTVASNVDAVRVSLDTLSFDTRRFARAAPRYDQTAFLMAEFKNETREPLLASGSASLYLDNTLIGGTYFEQVPAGAEMTLPFGPIEDLRLSFTVLDQSEGDRGIIKRSNAQSEVARMDIQNIGSEDWNVEVVAAVPYAVQEDLEIDWTASPMPDVRDVDDQRGVLQWNTDVAAGGTAQVTLNVDMEWPDGMVLR